jgi:hypothetical protein
MDQLASLRQSLLQGSDEDDLFMLITGEGELRIQRLKEDIPGMDINPVESVKYNELYRSRLIVVVTVCMTVLGRVCVAQRAATSKAALSPMANSPRQMLLPLADMIEEAFTLTPTDSLLCIEVAFQPPFEQGSGTFPKEKEGSTASITGDAFVPLNKRTGRKCIFEGSVEYDDLVRVLPAVNWTALTKAVEMQSPGHSGRLIAHVKRQSSVFKTATAEVSVRLDKLVVDWPSIYGTYTS